MLVSSLPTSAIAAKPTDAMDQNLLFAIALVLEIVLKFVEELRQTLFF
jgi:hypothetical protein